MIYGRATTCTTPLLPDEVNHVDPKMRDLMEWCWKKEPEKRPTCEEIRVSLNRFEIKDDRPKIGNECDSAFSQVKAARSSVTIDYQFVHRILCRVSTPGPFPCSFCLYVTYPVGSTSSDLHRGTNVQRGRWRESRYKSPRCCTTTPGVDWSTSY
jgi:hypothetical protein